MSQTDEIRGAIKILELPPLSSLQDLKQKYRQMQKKLHPDFGGNAEDSARLNEAYDIVRGYMENYKFSFGDEEFARQFPAKSHYSKFRF